MLRRRLILGILVTAPRDWKRLRDAVQATAADLGMSVDIDRGTGDNKVRREGRSHVTVIGAPLKAAAMAAVAGRIADSGANIDRIERMARYPVTAIDLHVSGAHPDRLRALLALEAAAQGVDIAVQPASLLRRGDAPDRDGRRLDADPGRGHRAARRPQRSARPRSPGSPSGRCAASSTSRQSLRERVALLAGIPSTALDEVYDELVLAPGARTLVRTLRRLGYRFALVSGGFSQITDRLAHDLGIHYSRANELEIVDGTITGRIVGDVVDRAGKAAAAALLRRAGRRTVESVVAIGDGANDLDMLEIAGLGIAYNAKALVQEAADTTVNVPYLDAIMYLLGISREEIEALDAEHGVVTPAPPV